MIIAAIVYVLAALLWAHEYDPQFDRDTRVLFVICAVLWPLMFALQVAGEWCERK